MLKFSRLSVFSGFATILVACSGGGDINSSAFDVPGDTRVARVVTTSSFGAQDTATYTYDESGRLDKITSIGDEEIVLIHRYDELGKLIVREHDYTATNRRDTIREYNYEGGRPTGYVESGLFDDPISSVEYRYSGNNIIGYDLTSLDEFSQLEIGTLAETGTYVLSNTGQIESITIDDMNTGSQRVTSFVTTDSGQRVSSETTDSRSPLIISSDWEYEEIQCTKSSLGTVLNWICVRAF